VIGRFLCWLGRHLPSTGVDPAWSLYWACHRCGQVQTGELARRRK
jgi:hypothetical protein